jgi:hypothetical protein
MTKNQVRDGLVLQLAVVRFQASLYYFVPICVILREREREFDGLIKIREQRKKGGGGGGGGGAGLASEKEGIFMGFYIIMLMGGD